MSGFGRLKPVRATAEKRRAPRRQTNVPGIIQTTAWQFEVTISDVSATGVRVVSRYTPPSRQDVRLYVNGLWLFGRIAWRRGAAFGIKFDEALNSHSPAELENAVNEASAYPPQFDREAALSDLANRNRIKSKIADDVEAP